MKKERISEYLAPVIIASVQWVLSLILKVDKAFFEYTEKTVIYYEIKELYYVFLVCVWCFVYHVCKKIKNKNTTYLRAGFVFGVYFLLMCIMMLFLWPGTWSWDDLYTLHEIREYTSLRPWHHILSGYYLDILLQIFPCAGGVIFFQNIIVSACVAFVVAKLEALFGVRRLGNKYLDVFVKLIPFLLPPVLMYQFSGYRMGPYVYLELVLLVMVLSWLKENKERSIVYLAFFCFLMVIVSAWRTESFLYIPCICGIIIFSKRITWGVKKKIVSIFVVLIGFWGMHAMQNMALGNSNYEVMSFMRPCAELVRVADVDVDAELLEAIDNVVSVEFIVNNPEYSGEAVYWTSGGVRFGYSDEEYSSFIKAFIRLSFKYPKVVLRERMDLFFVATTGGITNVDRAAILCDDDNEEWIVGTVINKKEFPDKPFFREMRKSLIYVLGMRESDGTVFMPLYRLVWNAALPMFVLFVAWLILLFKRDWEKFFVMSAVVGKICIVFLTEPAGWIMYLLSFYLIGYVCLVWGMLVLRTRFKM